MSALPADFVAPFRLDRMGHFVWDANDEMAADFNDIDGDTKAVRARGYGRIQKLPDGEAQMDEWEAWVERVAGGCTDPAEVVRRFNAEAAPRAS